MSAHCEAVFRLPNTLIYWPWPRIINPHYEEVKAASEAWFRSFKAFGLFASLAYQTSTKERLRTQCDFINLAFVIDEYTDNATPEVVRQYFDVIIDVLRNPAMPRAKDEVVLGAVAQGFWALGVKSASRTSKKRFIEGFVDYGNAVVQEARDRQRLHIRNVQDYLDVRHFTIGTCSAFALIELGYELPDEVKHHPTVAALEGLSRDMIIFDNDLASYNKEQAVEEYPHNIVVCVMSEQKCGLDAALLWVENLHWSTRNKFLTLWTEIPLWGPEIDVIASQYLHGLAHWVRSNESWSFESERYFGSNGEVVQQNRMNTLMPKQLSASEPLLIHISKDELVWCDIGM
ncbi:terpenoid synthase [Armillaria luteobubalina]|uniref:Terpene synthase n=1 Tax=Armillaria luteobubalina TaxID=153913 RepID=A0AA39PHC7_9AGAR|nr:terpenoid synthase [Armillaria luteobubalina]